VPESRRDVRKFTQPAFEEMARSLHASYLDRWSRHKLTELAGSTPEGLRQPKQPEPESTSSAA
jgi:hypothetical protein